MPRSPSALLVSVCSAAVLLIAGLSGAAQPPRAGILGQPAPAWNVSRWLNLSARTKAVDVADYRGKVVYLYCFQSWCPGCHSHGFPALEDLMTRYAGNDDVAFVAIQTAFEGFGANSPAGARKTAQRYDLAIPVGHDGAKGRPSALMRRYRTGGTPWTVIIDRAGVVRFNDFHVDVDRAEALIDDLLGATPDAGPPPPTPRRDGRDLVGRPLPVLAYTRPPVQPDGSPVPATPALTLYRWWTDGCPFCEKSLPAIESLRTRYEAKGLRVIGVYHPKPPRDVTAETVTATAARLGYHGALATDRDWAALRAAVRPLSARRATSMSLLVGADGTVRHVDPGPMLFPSDEPEHATEQAAFAALEAAIVAELQRIAQPTDSAKTPSGEGRD